MLFNLFICIFASNNSVVLVLYCIESMMIPPLLSEGVMIMFLFLDKPLNAAMCLLGKVSSFVLILAVTAISSDMNPLL